MAPRTVYANLPDGLALLSLWDQSLADMGNLGIIPCTATGTNAIALTPVASVFAPNVTALQPLQTFSFVAAATSTGPVTVSQIGSLVVNLKVYRPDGVTQANTGDIASGVIYILQYNAALNSNAGGLVFSAPGSGVQSVVSDTNVTGNITGTLLTLGWTGTLAAARLNGNVVQAITNDTNITGSISAQNLTLGWTGTLAAARLNSNVVQGITNDTNITGSITAQNLTLGWSGTLAIGRGGTGAATQSAAASNIFPTPTRAGDITYWNGTSWTTLAGNNSGTQVLQENSSGVPSWVTITGTGTVTSITPGNGLTSTLIAAAPGSAITSSGTLSGAALVNAQTGTTYAILDGDRAKLITASNAAAQAYSIAQAGAASAFQSGWYTDIRNISTNAAGIVTVTPTTSTINGASSLLIYPGQSVRIVSDGTNYQTAFQPAAPFLTAAAGANLTINQTTYASISGLSVSQGTNGTWLLNASLSLVDTGGAATINCRLTDGTTVFASSAVTIDGANQRRQLSLTGIAATPAGNIVVQCKSTTTTSLVVFNNSGDSKDSSMNVVRIQ